MFKHNDPLRLADEIQEPQNSDGMYAGSAQLSSIDGFQCLEAFGDDLSLEDSPLLDMEDLLLTA
tara:strand:- start:46 stop:237 length:192 start_codon:yes stop_codon:yes gene_type:complete